METEYTVPTSHTGTVNVAMKPSEWISMREQQYKSMGLMNQGEQAIKDFLDTYFQHIPLDK